MYYIDKFKLEYSATLVSNLMSVHTYTEFRLCTSTAGTRLMIHSTSAFPSPYEYYASSRKNPVRAESIDHMRTQAPMISTNYLGRAAAGFVSLYAVFERFFDHTLGCILSSIHCESPYVQTSRNP